MTREEAIARIKNHKILHKMNEPRAIYISEALDMAIKALEREPWEIIKKIPQDYCYDTETKDFLVYRNKYTGHEIHIAHPTPTPQYRLEQESVLDKIRTEIMELDNKVCQQFLIEDVDKEVHHAYQDCLAIIDKYKAESEG